MIRAGTALIIFGKIHFLQISENEFTHEITCDGMTSSMEFMQRLAPPNSLFQSDHRTTLFAPLESARKEHFRNLTILARLKFLIDLMISFVSLIVFSLSSSFPQFHVFPSTLTFFLLFRSLTGNF